MIKDSNPGTPKFRKLLAYISRDEGDGKCCDSLWFGESVLEDKLGKVGNPYNYILKYRTVLANAFICDGAGNLKDSASGVNVPTSLATAEQASHPIAAVAWRYSAIGTIGGNAAGIPIMNILGMYPIAPKTESEVSLVSYSN